jgi:hypothetical protein
MGIDKKEDIIQPFEKTKPARFDVKADVVARPGMEELIIAAKIMKN